MTDDRIQKVTNVDVMTYGTESEGFDRYVDLKIEFEFHGYPYVEIVRVDEPEVFKMILELLRAHMRMKDPEES